MQNWKNITLKAKGTASIGGTTLQLVSGSSSTAKGKYYGPVVLGNKSSTAAKSSVVYTKLKQKAATGVKLGTVTVKKAVGSTQQGYATTSTKFNIPSMHNNIPAYTTKSSNYICHVFSWIFCQRFTLQLNK